MQQWDLTEKLQAPDGRGIVLEDEALATLGAVVYRALVQPDIGAAYAEKVRRHDLAVAVCAAAGSYAFTTEELALALERVKALPQIVLAVPAARILEINPRTTTDDVVAAEDR
jgi:hypothetical protein